MAGGLRLVGHLSGAPMSGQVHAYVIPAGDATATFVGDLVKSGGTGVVPAELATSGQTLPTVVQSTAGAYHRGVITAMSPDPASLTKVNRLASTEQVVLVADDPGCIFEATEDGVGGFMAATVIGGNVEVIVGAGNTVTGQSGMLLDSSTAATTNTLSLKIFEPSKEYVNALGSVSTLWKVTINLHELTYTTGS